MKLDILVFPRIFVFTAKDTIPKFEGLGPFPKIKVFALIILDQISKLHYMVVTLRWALNSFSLKFLLFRSVLHLWGGPSDGSFVWTV